MAGQGVRAAKLLGMTEVPTIVIEHLTEAQVRALMIADNRLTELGQWNLEILGQQFRELSQGDIDFDAEITSFETGEIDLLIEEVESTTLRFPAGGPL